MIIAQHIHDFSTYTYMLGLAILYSFGFAILIQAQRLNI